MGQAVSEEMYLSTVDEESGDESMLLGTSTGAEDDLDVSNGNGIWERRRSAIFKGKRMVKIKDKDKGKAKPCKTIIIQEGPPPAPPALDIILLAVIWRWEGFLGGSDAFFALLWVVPELSASF